MNDKAGRSAGTTGESDQVFTHPELRDRDGSERVYETHKGMLKALRKRRAKDARQDRQRLERAWAKTQRPVSGGAPGLGRKR